MVTAQRARTLPVNALLVAIVATAVVLLSAFADTARAKVKCKSGLTNIYQDKFYEAKVVTDWCYDGKRVISRHSVPSDHVRNAAYVAGYREGQEGWSYTACQMFNGIRNHNCLTKRQFSYTAPQIPHSPFQFPPFCVSIETRIYGDGNHQRKIANC